MTDSEIKKIKELKEKGCGYKKISYELGIPINTVKSFLRRHQGITHLDDESSCCNCGTPIEHIPHHKKKRFCSDKCRMAWWNSHKSKITRKSEKEVVCAFCGKVFMSYPSKKRKYCSYTCSIAARRKEQKND